MVVLEDDPALLGLIGEGLRDYGYAVVETAKVGAARSALEGLDGRAILVVDRSVGSDGPVGFKLAGEALQRWPALRVVYITGTHLAAKRLVLSERERALLKPFALSQLEAAMRALGP